MNEYLIIAADKDTLRKGIKKMLYAEKPIMVAIKSGMNTDEQMKALKDAVDADIADSDEKYIMYPLEKVVIEGEKSTPNPDGTRTIIKKETKIPGAQLILQTVELLTDAELAAGKEAGLELYDRTTAPKGSWMCFQ